MRTLSLIVVILGVVVLVVAIISRVLLVPVPPIRAEAQALGQLASILFLLAIALNTLKQP